VVTAAVAVGQLIDNGGDPEQLRLAVRTAGDRGLLTRPEDSRLVARLRQQENVSR
jgi:hypothetical protein